MKKTLILVILNLCMNYSFGQKKTNFFDIFEIEIPNGLEPISSSSKRVIYQTESGVVLTLSYGERGCDSSEVKDIGNNTVISLDSKLEEFELHGSAVEFIDGLYFFKYDYSFLNQSYSMYNQMYFASINNKLLLISFSFLNFEASETIKANNYLMSTFSLN